MDKRVPQHVNYVKVAGLDVDGILRGKIMSRNKFISAASSGFGFCSVVFGWDMHDKTYDKELGVSNSQNGYRDLLAHVDLDSLMTIPWENGTLLYLVRFHDSTTDKPIPPCPRSLLRDVASRYLSLGATPMAGAEFEFYHYKETAESVIEKQGVGLKPMTPGMFGYSIQRPTLNQDYYYDVLHTCAEMGVSLEGWHTETGPGVYEAAIEYSSAVKMADRAAVFKLVCKSLGPKYGVLPCFMAKPEEGMPGNSGHLHVSLQDKNGNNLFSRPETDANAEWDDIKDLSDIGRWFLAGVLEGLPDIMPLFAPTINSYKRLVEHFWAPVTVSWGLENRLSSIRLITTGPGSKSTRFEVRTPGADVNTHYALSAIFALGYRGIDKKLALKVPPLSKSATTTAGLEKLPRSLRDATDRFAAPNSIAREVLGDEFVDHFAGTRYEELRLWDNAVTNWEVKRYIETV